MNTAFAETSGEESPLTSEERALIHQAHPSPAMPVPMERIQQVIATINGFLPAPEKPCTRRGIPPSTGKRRPYAKPCGTTFVLATLPYWTAIQEGFGHADDVILLDARSVADLARKIGWSYEKTDQFTIILGKDGLGILSQVRDGRHVTYHLHLSEYTPSPTPEAVLERLDRLIATKRAGVKKLARAVRTRFSLRYGLLPHAAVSSVPFPPTEALAQALRAMREVLQSGKRGTEVMPRMAEILTDFATELHRLFLQHGALDGSRPRDGHWTTASASCAVRKTLLCAETLPDAADGPLVPESRVGPTQSRFTDSLVSSVTADGPPTPESTLGPVQSRFSAGKQLPESTLHPDESRFTAGPPTPESTLGPVQSRFSDGKQTPRPSSPLHTVDSNENMARPNTATDAEREHCQDSSSVAQVDSVPEGLCNVNVITAMITTLSTANVAERTRLAKFLATTIEPERVAAYPEQWRAYLALFGTCPPRVIAVAFVDLLVCLHQGGAQFSKPGAVFTQWCKDWRSHIPSFVEARVSRYREMTYPQLLSSLHSEQPTAQARRMPRAHAGQSTRRGPVYLYEARFPRQRPHTRINTMGSPFGPGIGEQTALQAPKELI